MDETYAAYLDRVRAQRAELGESMGALEAALDLPVGLGPAWRGRVRAALTELAHDLRDHVELTESAGGFYDDILPKAPRLSRAVEAPKAEHASLLVEVERLAVLPEAEGAQQRRTQGGHRSIVEEESEGRQAA